MQGDLKSTLPVITEQIDELQTKDWLKALKEYEKNHPLCSKKNSLTEVAVLDELYKIIDQEAIVTVDVGQHEMWAAQRFPGSLPKKFLLLGDWGLWDFLCQRHLEHFSQDLNLVNFRRWRNTNEYPRVSYNCRT